MSGQTLAELEASAAAKFALGGRRFKFSVLAGQDKIEFDGQQDFDEVLEFLAGTQNIQLRLTLL